MTATQPAGTTSVEEPPVVTGHQFQIAVLLDQVAAQARNHAEEISVLRVNHAIEVQALKNALSDAGLLTETTS